MVHNSYADFTLKEVVMSCFFIGFNLLYFSIDLEVFAE